MHVATGYRSTPMRKLGVLLVLASCAGPSDAYVAADAATYGVIAPAHRAYVEADMTLTDEQKARRLLLLESWALRLREATK